MQKRRSMAPIALSLPRLPAAASQLPATPSLPSPSHLASFPGPSCCYLGPDGVKRTVKAPVSQAYPVPVPISFPLPLPLFLPDSPPSSFSFPPPPPLGVMDTWFFQILLLFQVLALVAAGEYFGNMSRPGRQRKAGRHADRFQPQTNRQPGSFTD